MFDSHETRLQKAKESLTGLAIADAFGAHFEFWRAGINRRYITDRQMPAGIWRFTDDTEMSLSIYAVLRQFKSINQDVLAASFVEHFDESRAYGTGAIKLLKSIQTGEDWRRASKDLFRGEGSFGNGAAMRVAPIGAYFAEDLDAVIRNAQLSAEVTHAHAEGIAGAIAVAVAAANAIKLQNEPKPSLADFLGRIIPHIPKGEVADNCLKAQSLATESSIDLVAQILGNGRNIAAMDTVPIAIWCAGKYLDNFEEAMWQLASIGGDVDTTCAISGSIIACYSMASVPQSWIESCEELPKWVFEDNHA